MKAFVFLGFVRVEVHDEAAWAPTHPEYTPAAFCARAVSDFRVTARREHDAALLPVHRIFADEPLHAVVASPHRIAYAAWRIVTPFAAVEHVVAAVMHKHLGVVKDPAGAVLPPGTCRPVAILWRGVGGRKALKWTKWI